MPIARSDHELILLTINSWKQALKNSPFRFEANWLLQKKFMKLVDQTWRKFIKSSCAHQLARKIEILKKKKN